MGADCSFYVKSIATYAPVFFGYNSSVLASVHGVDVDHWLCNPRVNGSIPGAGMLERLFMWMKINTQKQTVTELWSLSANSITTY